MHNLLKLKERKITCHDTFLHLTFLMPYSYIIFITNGHLVPRDFPPKVIMRLITKAIAHPETQMQTLMQFTQSKHTLAYILLWRNLN